MRVEVMKYLSLIWFVLTLPFLKDEDLSHTYEEDLSGWGM